MKAEQCADQELAVEVVCGDSYCDDFWAVTLYGGAPTRVTRNARRCLAQRQIGLRRADTCLADSDGAVDVCERATCGDTATANAARLVELLGGLRRRGLAASAAMVVRWRLRQLSTCSMDCADTGGVVVSDNDCGGGELVAALRLDEPCL
jgi:hypothetical protein